MVFLDLNINKSYLKFKKLSVIIAIFPFISIFFPLSYLNSKDNLSFLPLKEFQKQVGGYRINPGDKLMMKIYDFEELTSTVKVLPDGTINLPRINTLNVNGLSVEEAVSVIKYEYKKLLKNPLIYLNIIEPETIKVNIIGEVQVPGVYSLGSSESNLLRTQSGLSNDLINSTGWPTLIDSVQKAGGFTIFSDLRNIKLTRKNKKNSNLVSTNINIWNSLSSDNYFENPYLYSGDVIVVGKIKDLDESEIFSVANSSFSPSNININIVGEVIKPGLTKVRSNTRLMEAIYAAGGLKRSARKDKIKVIRMLSNGAILKKNYIFHEKSPNNQTLNPFLKDGDIVIVNSNFLNKASNFAGDVLKPTEYLLRTKMLLDIFDN